MNIYALNSGEVRAMLADLREQYPLAVKYASNAMVKQLWTSEKEQMRSDLNKPVAWSVNAINYKNYGVTRLGAPATDGAAIYIADEFHSGLIVNPDQYIGVQIYGGQTAGPRSSEKRMQQAGILPKDYTWVPAKGVKLDPSGNVPGSIMSAIISNIGLNQYGVVKEGNENFALFPKPSVSFKNNAWKTVKPIGVLAKVYGGGESVWLPYLWFVPKKKYQKRYKFWERADSEIRAHLVEYLQKYTKIAIEKAAAR